MWESLKHVLPSKRSKNVAVNNDLCAENFNTFFTSIGTRITSHFNNDNLPNMPSTALESEKHFNFIAISPLSVLKSILSLPAKSSVDILGFDNQLLCIAADEIHIHIAYLFNLSLMTSIVPKDWKRACVTPVYKGKGDTGDPSNYRPISITATVSKIFEHLIKKQIVDFIENCSLISNCQSAYLRGRSTQTALHSVLDVAMSNMDNGSINLLCSLDMTKGFDTISHKVLLHKLRYYGFNENVISWINSYLSERTQFVKYNSRVSSELPIQRGVPQGSVLGPILFILYVNDLVNIFTDCNCTMYADDTNLYCHAPTFAEAQSKLQACLDLISKWLFENQLVVNASKSSIMVVTRKSLPISNLNFHLCGNIIPITEETKLLGVLIDSKLTYKGHIQAMLKKLSSKVGLLHRVSRCLEQEQLCLIYNAFIQSNLDYCITVWGSCYKSYLAKLQRLQNRCARIITRNFDYNTPSSALISSLAWMSVETRYKYFVGILMFKCFYNLVPDNIVNRFTLVRNSHTYDTRSAYLNDYVRPIPKTEIFKRSLLYFGPSLWNTIPQDIRNCTSVKNFKFLFKRHLLQS